MSSFILQQDNGGIRILQLNRPDVLNALNDSVMADLVARLEAADADASVRVIIITGSEKAFAAGADIAAMQSMNYSEVYQKNFISSSWDGVLRIRKPIIAAVSGYALGGGCELAMMCDMIFATETAKFGQPEIKLGIIPGAGGTQRLARAIGKAKTMDMVLTGRLITAQEAEQAGLVARVLPTEGYLDAVVTIAQTIAGMSAPSVMMAKESVNQAFETSLQAGLLFERRNFHALFGTHDQKEGMQAFLEKRTPSFKDA